MTSDFSSRRVLVADDEKAVGQLLCREVEHVLGCKSVLVSSGDEALEVLGEKDFDVLITDMIMPGCHGLELVKRVKTEHPGLPIIVTTGFPSEFPYVEVVRQGASDFCAKPYHREEMLAKVIRILKERALLEELAREKDRILREMDEREQLRLAHAAAEERYRNLFEYSMDGMLLVSVDQKIIRDANRAFTAISGMSREKLEGSQLLDLFTEHEQPRLMTGFEVVQQIGQITLGDLVLAGDESRRVYLDVNISLVQGNPENILQMVCKDVTEQREMQRRLAELAQTDQLTGLFNKGAFLPRLEGMIARTRKAGQALTLLFIDLDNFKQCNDKHGHQVGDALLSEVGRLILKHTRRRTDDAFRYGGDEFAIVLSQADSAVGANVANRIREEYTRGDCYGTSMSIGVCQYDGEMEPAEFVKRSDMALYTAKRKGKNTTWISGAEGEK